MPNTSLQNTLYDSRLTNDQRIVISEYMYSPTPIKSARISGDNGGENAPQLYIWIKGETCAYRVAPDGNVWPTY